MNIKRQIIILTFVLLFASAAVIGFFYWQNRQHKLFSKEDIRIHVDRQAEILTRKLREKYTLSKKLITKVEKWVEESNPDSSISELVDMVADYLVADKDEFVEGYWINIESSFFQRKQIDEVVSEGKPENKQFATYTFRNGSELVISYGFKDNSIETFYYDPFHTGVPYITSPYFFTGKHNIDGVEHEFDPVHMLTLSLPIRYHSKIIGVGGVDFELNALSEFAAEVNYKGYGSARLISNNYIVLADSNVNKTLGDNLSSSVFLQNVFKKLKKNEVVDSMVKNDWRGTIEYKVYFPVFIADSEICWMLEFAVLKNNIE